MLRDHKLRQQAARRGEALARWRLYETEAGNVPKDLAVMFSGIERARQVKKRPKKPVLTPAENAVLDKSLQFIERHGLKKFESVTDPRGEVPPNVTPVVAAKGPLMELKVKSAAHNPRFIYVDCDGVVVFLDAFKKKTQKLAKQDIVRSEERYASMKARGECQ